MLRTSSTIIILEQLVVEFRFAIFLSLDSKPFDHVFTTSRVRDDYIPPVWMSTAGSGIEAVFPSSDGPFSSIFLMRFSKLRPDILVLYVTLWPYLSYTYGTNVLADFGDCLEVHLPYYYSGLISMPAFMSRFIVPLGPDPSSENTFVASSFISQKKSSKHVFSPSFSNFKSAI
ncbi:hypothetical protein CPB84DRAFT_223013 [Gymnopilus junonius]|uniref:Uncharacterized protein n=1 Tax=Gymnopilus junonius TaxID=109634 RepID=A0A9P5NGK6_GYMJU|nr:hypothetical protein CPB84DRAFT_223013 [Gymnopilus junonius]